VHHLRDKPAAHDPHPQPIASGTFHQDADHLTRTGRSQEPPTGVRHF
jgi:hypothetical protein